MGQDGGGGGCVLMLVRLSLSLEELARDVCVQLGSSELASRRLRRQPESCRRVDELSHIFNKGHPLDLSDNGGTFGVEVAMAMAMMRLGGSDGEKSGGSEENLHPGGVMGG